MSELMKRRKKLTEPEVRYYILQLTSALSYLHDSYIIHRDLKLGNIFLDSHMRVKVGDFGLATKLTHPGERRKTVCGTPNYIAPEILKGKTNGHSFEVDIWSTGIIIYTLLVGRPPYEAENVDATYRRILENRYSFPPDCGVSENARSLIQDILQLKPETRPSLLCMESAAFFTAPGVYTPTALSSAAMREPPAMCIPAHDFPRTSLGGYSKAHGAALQPVNDENDAGAINRLRPPPVAHQLHLASPPRKVLASCENSDGFEATGGLRSQINRGRASSTSRGLSSRGTGTTTAAAITTTTSRSERSESSGRVRKTRSSLSSNGATATETSSHSSRRAMQPQQRYVASSGGVAEPFQVQQHERKGYARQFEVYNDAKSAAATCKAALQGGDVSLKRPKSSRADSTNRLSSQGMSGKRSTDTYEIDETEDGTGRDGAMAESDPEGTGEMGGNRMADSEDAVVNEIQQNLEQCGIQSTDDKPKHAWATGTLHPSTTEGDRRDSANRCSDDFAREDRGSYTSPTAGSRGVPPKHPDTLECMYKNLESSIAEPESRVQGRLEPTHDVAAEDAPKVWVVRHVDYTSKYGLGFLLNTGSAGVYFNDSTKIVLSGVGDVFQYIERKRRSNSGVVEHSVQTHSLSNFPPDLTKKVTLLKHFKNYLMDQMQQSGTACEAQMIFQQGIEAAAGHGALSTSPLDGHDELLEGGDLPYVKKWVRTRHAILFRLSNRTVQVVFFDQSEVILSSEARVMSYLSKTGVRSNYTLETVFNSGKSIHSPIRPMPNICYYSRFTGRSDIEKRIKYTKDIMARLINMQPHQKDEN